MTSLPGLAPSVPAGAPAPRRTVRLEIQALRAVAVLLVVVYHLWPHRLTGGYVGVDVFFVISGFLITSHLLSEVARTGTVSLPRFWARRIRRLLPAASIVLLSSAVAMFAFVPPSLWERTGRELTASALYFQNWALAANSIDYLGAEGSASLVQHFWSLSVEEQFYIAWPILIVLALVISRRTKSHNPRRVLLVALAAIFVLSLVFSAILTHFDPNVAYFHTGTRAWEFAAGGLLAFLPAASKRLLQSRAGLAVNALGAWAGWALILGTGLLFTPRTPFPGYLALLPVLGTVLVIAAGRPDSGFSINRVSGFWPVRKVGDLSYAIYLWHWPLIVVVPYITVSPLTTVQKIGILAVSIGLAVLSQRFIERPVQLSTRLAARPRTSYLFAALSALVMVGLTVTSALMIPHGQPRPVAAAQLSSQCFGAAAQVNSESCSEPYAVSHGVDTVSAANDRGSLGLDCNSPETEVVMCEFGDLKTPLHTIALIGNSHAGHLVGALSEYGKTHHWKIILMRHTGCSGALADDVIRGTEKVCLEWTKNVRAEILGRADIDTVVFGTNRDSQHYFTKARVLKPDEVTALRSAVSATLDEYADAGKTVMVFGDVPGHFTDPVPQCVFLHRDQYDPCATPRDKKEAPDEINFIADAAVASGGRIGYHDLTDYFCDARECHVVIGGVIAYIDQNHMSDTYSRSLAPYLGDALEYRMGMPRG